MELIGWCMFYAFCVGLFVGLMKALDFKSKEIIIMGVIAVSASVWLAVSIMLITS